MTERTEAIDLDGGDDVAKVQTAEAETPRDDDGTPYCKEHHCRLKATTSGPKGSPKTYYKCPVPDCDTTGIKIKHGAKTVPQQPQVCPRCSTEKAPVYCERDKRLSNHGSVVLTCPKCGWRTPHLALPHADLVRRHMRRRQDAGSIGER